MSSESFHSLVWNTPAGVMAQAVNLASRSDRSTRKQETGQAGSHRSRMSGAWAGLPIPLAAAGLMFAGFALGTALVATIIS
jgi:hypothetical protein